MTDLESCKAQALTLLAKRASSAFYYEIEISEGGGACRVIRICELTEEEAAEMNVRCPPDYQVVFRASSEIELYREIIARFGP